MTREVILVGVVCLLCIAWVARKKRLQERRAQVVAAKAQVARALRPRTPEDSPECQEATPGAEEGNMARPVVRPWSEESAGKEERNRYGRACRLEPDVRVLWHYRRASACVDRVWRTWAE